jgi:hypothetical protein
MDELVRTTGRVRFILLVSRHRSEALTRHPQSPLALAFGTGQTGLTEFQRTDTENISLTSHIVAAIGR